MTPEQLFGHLLATRAAQPFVTYYDEASGERSELSAKSLANWVVKTHHLLVDELGLEVGDRAAVALPPHWISVPILLGCLTAGLVLADPGTAPEGADVAFVAPGRLVADAPDVFAIAPDTAAVGFGATPPEGWADYVTAVRPQADTWPTVQLRATDADDCLVTGVDSVLTRGATVLAAQERAADLGLTPGGRALTTRDWDGPADWIDTVLAPLAVSGSVVIVRHCPDDAVLERRMAQERADVRI